MKKLLLILICVLAPVFISGCLRLDVHVETPEPEESSDAVLEAAARELIDAAPVAQSRHRRDDDYMADFQTYYITAELPLSVNATEESAFPESSSAESSSETASSGVRLTLHMADRIYEEELLRDCANALWRDLEDLNRAADTAPGELTVYLVTSTVDGFPVNTGSRVFCTLDDFESGAYREVLCGAAYGLTSVWQTTGLAAYAFESSDDTVAESRPSDEAEPTGLAAYYADESHALTATCSALHLSPLFSDEETVAAARETARSLTAYLIEQEGFDAFLSTVNASEKIPAWLKSQGIDVPWTLPEVRPEMTDIVVLPKKGYLAEVRADNISICIEADSWLTETDGLYRWLLDYYAGMDLVMDRIRAEAPSAADIAEQRLQESIKIIFTSAHIYTVTYPAKNEITLSQGGAIWHEMVHLILEEYVPNASLAWECEGIAEHFSHEAETTYAPTQYIARGLDAYLEFFAEESGKDAEEDDLKFHQLVWTLYQEFAGPEGSENDDLAAFCHAYGISSLILDGKIDRTQVRKKYDISVASKRGKTPGKKSVDGNALSYPESEVLFEYLAEKYGMDAAVEAYMNGLAPDQAFGISYSELLAEAKAYFTEQYWRD